MPYVQVTSGLTLTIPTNGTRNWGSTMRNTTWQKISQHQHTGSGDGAKMVTDSYTDYSVTLDKLAKNIGFYQQTGLTPSGTSQAIDWANGAIVPLDLGAASGDVTLSFSNPTRGGKYKIIITQAATPRDIFWPTIKWENGQSPLLSQSDDAIDIVELYYDGTSYYGEFKNSYA
jgi:hypothetical protein